MFGVARKAGSGAHATRIFKHYAAQHQALYFGTVDRHKSDYHLVRGFSASHEHKDIDHCIGTFGHHDFVLVRRTNTLGELLICEVDLHTFHPFSHFFVLPNSLASAQFDTIITHYPTYRHAPFAPLDDFPAKFKNNYAIFTKPTYFERSLYFANGQVAQAITEAPGAWGYEVVDNSLFVYAFAPAAITDKSLDTFVRHSCQLAATLETKHTK